MPLSVAGSQRRSWRSLVVPLAHAELPQLDPVQMLGPDRHRRERRSESAVPDPPFFGSGLALQGNVALAGMPGAFDEKGRVAALVRNAAGQWVRVPDADGEHACSRRRLRRAHCDLQHVRADLFTHRRLHFQAAIGQVERSRQTAVWPRGAGARSGCALEYGRRGRQRFDRRRGLRVSHEYRRHVPAHRPLRSAGRSFERSLRRARCCLQTRRSQSTAPGYNSGPGRGLHVQLHGHTMRPAAEGGRERRSAAATTSATQSISRTAVLVVGAPSANWVPGDPALPPSEQNHRAGGSAYLFVRKRRDVDRATETASRRASAELVCDLRLPGRGLRHARRDRRAVPGGRYRAGLRGRLPLVGRRAVRGPHDGQRQQPRRNPGACSTTRCSQAFLQRRRTGAARRSTTCSPTRIPARRNDRSADTVRRDAPSL